MAQVVWVGGQVGHWAGRVEMRVAEAELRGESEAMGGQGPRREAGVEACAQCDHAVCIVCTMCHSVFSTTCAAGAYILPVC